MSSLEILAERLQDAISDTVCMTGEQRQYTFFSMQVPATIASSKIMHALYTVQCDTKRAG